MIVGKFYEVPAVRVAQWHRFVGWLPVMGPFHEDAEFVGLKPYHFHADWRFMPQRLWNYFEDWRSKGGHFGWPIQCPDGHGHRVILEGPLPKRMTYKRDPGRFPIEAARWLEPLGRAMACAKITNGLCPHRGIPVSAMHREGDILTCPGHGLQWNAITGLPHTSNSSETQDLKT